MRTRALASLLGPDRFDLGCEECFTQLDRYVELELVGAEAARAIPGMRAHLQGCEACKEDHRSLLDLVDRSSLAFRASLGDGFSPRPRR